MRPDRLNPLRELLQGVADARPHGGRGRGLGILASVLDVVDGAIELALVLDDVARLAPPVFIPRGEEVGVLGDRCLVELLLLGHLDEHDLRDGLGGAAPASRPVQFPDRPLRGQILHVAHS